MILAALLTSLFVAAPVLAEDKRLLSAREENTLSVGPWSVWCARDGALSGLNHEECRGWIERRGGRISVTRVHDGMTVSFDGALCRRKATSPPSAAQDLPRQVLARPKLAVVRLEEALNVAADTCGAPRQTFRRADLRALLKMTSGLSNRDFSKG
jgi:hypothetical protein